MAVFTHNEVQLIQPNSPASLLIAVPCPWGIIRHQNESGIITLMNKTGLYVTRYLVIAKANISIPEGGTVTPISIALQSEGGVLITSKAIVTPAVVGDYFNATCIGVVETSCGCCNRVAVINSSEAVTGETTTPAQAINIQNLVVTISII